MQRNNNINNYNNRKSRVRKRQRGGKSKWVEKGGYSYQTHISPAFAPLMPREFSVALCDRINGTVTSSTTLSTTFYPLVEYFGRLPMYAAQLYDIYKYSRVTAITLQIILINTGTQPVELAVAVVPYSDLAGLTLGYIVERPRSIRKIASASGGLDRVEISRTEISEQAFGNPYLDRDFWVDATQAASTTPLDSREPGIVIGTQSVTGTAASYYLEVKATYHLQFFDQFSKVST